MFTGIIEELGYIRQIDKNSITITCNKILEDIKIGDSIAVDGVCLTVTTFCNDYFTADISDTTLKVTKLGDLKTNDIVNLERAMQASSRFGGHIVSGHIDCTLPIKKLTRTGDFYFLELEVCNNYVIRKGSITIDGISLTVAETTDSGIKITIIPHTFENTNLKYLKTGMNVNIEFDIFAKYIEKNLQMKDNSSNITTDFLRENGFI